MAAKLAGPGGDSRFDVEAKADINVTPFVDVMLVLLIIFMVAAPLATVDVKLQLPNAVATPSQTPPKPIYISIQQNGHLYIMNFKTDLFSLGADLKSQLNGSKRDPTKERIYIRADKDTQYGAFMDVMNTLQDNGYYSVALVGIDQNRGKGAAG